MAAQRRGDGSSLTLQRVVLAVLLGGVLGLAASLVSITRRTSTQRSRRQLDSIQWRLTVQENVARDERRRRETLEKELAAAELEHSNAKRQAEEAAARVVKVEARLTQVAAELDTAKKERDAVRKEMAALIRSRRSRSSPKFGSGKAAAAFASESSAGRGAAALAGAASSSSAAAIFGGASAVQVDRHARWRPSAERDRLAADPVLAALLRKVAVNDEVLVAISNRNYAGPDGMLATWIQCVQRARVSNAMVVALDSDTLTQAQELGMPAHFMHLQASAAQRGTGENHAVSSLKFRLLRAFLALGYAVLLSDVDVVTLRDPWPHLARDSTVEAMSDGWDNATAYGYNDVADDPAMGWARYAHSMRVFVFNSGLFYIRPTAAALDVLDRVAARLDAEAGWDQAVFNEVLFFPSRPSYTEPAATRRVLDYLLFVNSKVLFRTLRREPRYARHLPVMVHVNYHPDKHARMLAIIERYIEGRESALDPFPDGSQ